MYFVFVPKKLGILTHFGCVSGVPRANANYPADVDDDDDEG